MALTSYIVQTQAWYQSQVITQTTEVFCGENVGHEFLQFRHIWRRTLNAIFLQYLSELNHLCHHGSIYTCFKKTMSI